MNHAFIFLTANSLSNYFLSQVENHVDYSLFTLRLEENRNCLDVNTKLMFSVSL